MKINDKKVDIGLVYTIIKKVDISSVYTRIKNVNIGLVGTVNKKR